MTVDWQKPICIEAKDWQDQLPARVVQGPDNGDYCVAIEASHRLKEGGPEWSAGRCLWFRGNGEFRANGRSDELRIINKKALADEYK